VIAIETDDGEWFAIGIDGVDHKVHRNDLVPFVDQVMVLLDVTREMITEPTEE
jgi:hypothetical protein